MLWFSLFLALAVMFAGWLWQCRQQNAGIVDVLWAFNLGLIAIVYAVFSDGSLVLRLLIAVIMGGWYLRLSWHLARRVLAEAEDGRYAYLRQHWGASADKQLLWFFLAQALLAWLLALPAWVIANGHIEQLQPQHLLAVVLALVAFVGVHVADQQLHAFRTDPANKGKVCEVGLWRYSRHPNYFFEWLHWFSYPILAVGLSYGAWLWLAPLVMLAFLYFISGIPYTEQQALRSRGDAYRRYQQTTSPFIPWRKRS